MQVANRSGPNILFDAAFEYSERGWAVLPMWWPRRGTCACGDSDCPSAAKHPLGRLVPHGVLNATLDHERIASWWSRYPSANVAIATGKQSRLVVIDVDAKGDGAAHLERLQQRYLPLPETVEAASGGGGRHLYFAHDDGAVPSTVDLTRGVDVRAERGCIIAPPSTHISGARYRWRHGRGPGQIPLASLPAWIADLARHRDPPRALRERRSLTPATVVDQQVFRELMAGFGVHPRGREQEMHRCPWHPDEHPSLSVHWAAAVFHCFGCEAGGGIGTLRRLTNGDDWPW